MKVLMYNRPDVFTHLGGDCIQTIKTAEFLRKIGVEVKIAVSLDDDPKDFDVVHLFNITRAKNTKNALDHYCGKGTPVVLSTIYWNTDELEQKAQTVEIRPKNMSYGKRIEYFVRKSVFAKNNRTRKQAELHLLQSDVLRRVDLILPNSKAEESLVFRDFFEKESVVVPNAVDADAFARPDADAGFPGLDIAPGFVMCAARFDERKNQLRLIKALKSTGIKLVLVGAEEAGMQSEYEKLCVEEADENVVFLPRMDHEALAALYARASVHVLPSWYETPGLSSLEAALCGCNVVITDKGSTREYFGDFAEYCDPESEESIREAVLKSLKKDKSSGLADIIKREYTWEKAAVQTLSGYEKAVRLKK